MSTLLLVAHGSRDPRSARALRGLADVVRSRVASVPSNGEPPLWDRVELAFLEFSSPVLEDVTADLRGEVVVVPLLLAEAFHARFDLPGRLAAVQDARSDVHFTTTPVLGPSPLLDAAVARRGAQLLDRGHDGLVVLATGSSRRRANAEVDDVATRVGHRLGVPVAAAAVTRGAGRRTLDEALARLRTAGARSVGVVPWFLAPGRLLDSGCSQAADAGVTDVARPLADDPSLASLVLDRAHGTRALTAAA